MSDHGAHYGVAIIDSTGFPQSLSGILCGCTCSLASDCGSRYLRHTWYPVLHAAQITKACEQIVYPRASLDACTCQFWLGLQILEQGDCLGCGEAVA